MERIKRFIHDLSRHQWLDSRELADWEVHSTVYKLPGQYEEKRKIAEHAELGRVETTPGMTYFISAELDIPKEWTRPGIGLVFESGGEGLLRINGVSRQGLDRNHAFVSLDRDLTGGRLKLEVELYDPLPEPEDPLNRQVNTERPVRRMESRLVWVNRPVQSLMYSVETVAGSIGLLPEGDLRRSRLLEAVYRAIDGFTGLSEAEIRSGKAAARLERELREGAAEWKGAAEGLMHMVGQSHIDVAWLWPVRETVRKVSRTFSTVDALMDEYPEYRYAQSQPQLYAFLKENDPELYARVKERIRQGRWELVGGMWVEPDLNIPGGEALMRQLLYGQSFYKEEFGMTSAIEWLPDTFGYCASLPQILKHGGIRYFMTSKLNWNDTNTFPCDLFYWEGIDGTAVLSYLNHGLNEHTRPQDIHEHWQSYRQKGRHNEQMLLYGHGDGGGGATREMLEYTARSELMAGQPASVFSSAAEFFAGIGEKGSKLPRWRGDLYLELHRGTYTTHARSKRNNRKAEVLYREAEMWQALAGCGLNPAGRREGAEKLKQGWRLILLNQFHDIIPGSSIPEVYETSAKEYGEVFRLGGEGLSLGLAALAAQVSAAPDGVELAGGLSGKSGEGVEGSQGSESGKSGESCERGKDVEGVKDAEDAKDARALAVFNSLGWERDAVIELSRGSWPEGAAGIPAAYDEHGALTVQHKPGDGDQADTLQVFVPGIPAFGYKTVWLLKDGNEGTGAAGGEYGIRLNGRWETPYYRIRFNENGEIVSLYDKEAEREAVLPGERANRFHFFHDRPACWDAWDVDSRYEEQPAGDAVLIAGEVVQCGPVMDVLRFRWSIGQSEITQDMKLYRHSRRIDFETSVSWKESHKLLKVGFPVNVVADKAVCEIPFGALERTTHKNTSWDQAQFEVCAHRFVDVSEYGYGVSLLNDCKYGYDMKDSTIRLSLLRAPKWPDNTADLGEHIFTYSLFPHAGDWRDAFTLRHAAELNLSPPVVPCVPQAGALPSGSLIGFTGRHVVLDTVKPAEDGRGVVVRLYESSGGREQVSLEWRLPWSRAVLSNALEEELEELASEPGAVSLAFRPFEIKTVRII